MNVALAEELRDAVVDVTAKLHVTAWLVGPYQQTKIQRVVAEVEKLYTRRRISQHIRHTLRRFDQRVTNELNVRIIVNANGDSDPRGRISVRPVDHALGNKFGIRPRIVLEKPSGLGLDVATKKSTNTLRQLGSETAFRTDVRNQIAHFFRP